MNKLIVSLLLTLGITGAAVAAEGPSKVMPLPVKRKPPYVVLAMDRMVTARRRTSPNWPARVSVT